MFYVWFQKNKICGISGIFSSKTCFVVTFLYNIQKYAKELTKENSEPIPRYHNAFLFEHISYISSTQIKASKSMFIKYWLFDKSKITAEVNANKYLKDPTKENLTLSKRQAKHLKALFSKLISTDKKNLTCKNFQNFEVDSLFHIKHFNKITKEIELPKWNEPSLINKCDFTKELKTTIKEKVTLTKEDKVYLAKIISLRIRNLYVDPFTIKILCFQDTSYSINLIGAPKHIHNIKKSIIIEKYIPTNTYQDMDQNAALLNENEDFNLSPIEKIIPKIPLVLIPFDTMDQYIFHIDSKGQNNNSLRIPIDILIWDVKYKEQENNIISTFFKKLELKLFDIEFHKFEFFKFACHERLKNNSKPAKITKFWKLSKIQLKQMKWSPFKKWNKLEVYKRFQAEQISLVDFSMPTFTSDITLYIPNTDLDLYERNRGSMKNLQINTEIILYDKNNEALIEVDSRRKERTSKDSYEGEDQNNKNSSYLPVPSSILIEGFSDKISLTIPKKRSFLDSELQSIIAKKKSQMKVNKKTSDQTDKISRDYSTREDITNIFQSGIFSNFENTTELRHIEQMENVSSQSYFDSSISNLLHGCFPIDLIPKFNIKDKLIIFNSNRITNNYKLLQGLINQKIPSCIIIERDFVTNCDIVLNCSTCVICLELAKFFQRRASGDLYYLDILKDCLQEYKRIKIMFDYDPDLIFYDNDIFWKIYLYLPFPCFELFFVPNGNISILVQHTNKLIWKEASTNISITEFEDNKDSENDEYEENGNNSYRVEDILLKLNFNPILAKILVKKYNNNLTNILLQINDGVDPYLLKTMTTSQLNRLKKLDSINW